MSSISPEKVETRLRESIRGAFNGWATFVDADALRFAMMLDQFHLDRRPGDMIRGQRLSDALTDLDAILAMLAIVEGEREAALADCRVLAEEVAAARNLLLPSGQSWGDAIAPSDRHRYMLADAATDASGSLTRHAKGGAA